MNESRAVLTFRTSGTEPKLKYYSELSGSDPVAALYVGAGLLAVVCTSPPCLATHDTRV